MVQVLGKNVSAGVVAVVATDCRTDVGKAVVFNWANPAGERP